MDRSRNRRPRPRGPGAPPDRSPRSPSGTIHPPRASSPRAAWPRRDPTGSTVAPSSSREGDQPGAAIGDHGLMAAGRWSWRRFLLLAVSVVFIAATFFYFLPKIADYRDVWGVLDDLTWPWVLALLGATVLNVLTFAPPWVVVLPGLRFRAALVLTQVSTALSIVAPGGAGVGPAGSFGLLRPWGFAPRQIGRAVTLVTLWNQFANLSYPIIAVFLLTATGGGPPRVAPAGAKRGGG